MRARRKSSPTPPALREQATAALYRLRSGGERIALRRESAAALTSSLRADLAALRAHDPSASVGLEAAARDCGDRRPGGRGGARTPAGRGRSTLGAASRRANGQSSPSLAAELDDVLARRAETEAQLTGGRRDALLALRGAAQRLGVRHESAQRLLSELQAGARRGCAMFRQGPRPPSSGSLSDEADAAARAAVREQEDLEARVRLAPGAPDRPRAVARRAGRAAARRTSAGRGGRAARAPAARGRVGRRALDGRGARPSRVGGARGESRPRARAGREGEGRQVSARCSSSSAGTRASS